MVKSEHMDFGLVGRKLGHSLSPELFRELFDKYQVDATYHLFEIASVEDICNLPLWYPELYGFNVTVPYKETILPYLDILTPEAERIGAVNTVYINRNSTGKNGAFRLIGHNTDYTGFLASIANLYLKGKRALILGSGGASRAVSNALLSIGMDVTIVSRTLHLYPLNENERDGLPVITYDQLDMSIMREVSIIVNTTPVGMWPEVDFAPPVPQNLINESMICYDLIYNPRITRFMQYGLEKGAMVVNGLSMLKHQAYDAWNFWLEYILKNRK